MQSITIERNIWINAPRDRVWQAISDPAQIPQWFLPALPGATMKQDARGKLSVQLGPMAADIALLEVTEPPQKLVSRSLPDRLLATTYLLADEKGGTRVTVTISGFEALPEDERQDRHQVSGAAWEKALDNLKAFVAGAALPFPQAPVAPLFGFWREVKDRLVVERTVWINAPRDRVWQAITDPDQVEQWFAPGTKFKASGSGVGARLYVENPETGAEMYVQITEVFDPPTQLVTRAVPEPGEVATTTTWRLVDEKGGTRLMLTYAGYELMPEDVRPQRMEENTFGFGMMMANIKAVIEGTPLPVPQGF